MSKKNVINIHAILPQYMRDSGGTECTLPFAADARDEAVGASRVYTRFAQAAGNAPVSIKIRRFTHTYFNFSFSLYLRP